MKSKIIRKGNNMEDVFDILADDLDNNESIGNSLKVFFMNLNIIADDAVSIYLSSKGIILKFGLEKIQLLMSKKGDFHLHEIDYYMDKKFIKSLPVYMQNFFDGRIHIDTKK